jgi:GPH family glycoside/pentoside/hexuronide:cation symporter
MDVTTNATTKQSNTMEPNAKLSFLERFAYGLGDYSGNLVYSSISAFLLVYYISVVGVDSGVAASVMAISKIFDGISDLIMGRIVDRTHSKWGKARPWIIRMCIPLAICTVLMFSVPAGLTGTLQIAYIFLTYNLVSTVFYTGLNVPYSSLQGLMTTNSYERGLLGNFRMLLATFGTMTVNTVVLKMTGYFGGGDTYSQKGWTITFIILMVVFLALNCLTFFCCKERVMDTTAEGDSQKDSGPSAIECLKSLLKNKNWIIMVIFLFALYFMMSTFFGGNYYFAAYVVGNEGAYSSLANALSLSQVLIMFVTPFIMKKIGKRNTGLVGMVFSTVGFIMTALAGKNVTLILISNVVKGASFGCGAAVMFGMLQDCITYGQWYTGVQAIGMGNAASSFCMKVGSGVGTAALGYILSLGNFDVDPTSASAITAINVACIWIPIVVGIIGVVCMVLMDLDKKFDQVSKDLAEGKWRGSVE